MGYFSTSNSLSFGGVQISQDFPALWEMSDNFSKEIPASSVGNVKKSYKFVAFLKMHDRLPLDYVKISEEFMGSFSTSQKLSFDGGQIS